VWLFGRRKKKKIGRAGAQAPAVAMGPHFFRDYAGPAGVQVQEQRGSTLMRKEPNRRSAAHHAVGTGRATRSPSRCRPALAARLHHVLNPSRYSLRPLVLTSFAQTFDEARRAGRRPLQPWCNGPTVPRLGAAIVVATPRGHGFRSPARRSRGRGGPRPPAAPTVKRRVTNSLGGKVPPHIILDDADVAGGRVTAGVPGPLRQ